MKQAINPKYENINIDEIIKLFEKNNTPIHKARNEIKVLDYKNKKVVVKSFKIPHIINRFAYAYLRDSKANKSYQNSLKIGDLTPTPIAFRNNYKNTLLDTSYYICENFDYDFTIESVIHNPDFKNRVEILKQFASFTFKLHEKGILHKDYSPGNILINKENAKYIFKIIDVNRMIFKKLNINERLKNFAKLWISDKDLSLIIKYYAPLNDINTIDASKIATKHSHQHKNKINFKKRLRNNL